MKIRNKFIGLILAVLLTIVGICSEYNDLLVTAYANDDSAVTGESGDYDDSVVVDEPLTAADEVEESPVIEKEADDSNGSDELEINCDDYVEIIKGNNITITALENVNITSFDNYSSSILYIKIMNNELVVGGLKEGSSSLTIHGSNGKQRTITIKVVPVPVRVDCGESVTIEVEDSLFVKKTSSVHLKYVYSRDESVASILDFTQGSAYGSDFRIKANKIGETDIDITGENGTKAVVHVTVAEKAVVTLNCGTNPTVCTGLEYPYYSVFNTTKGSAAVGGATSSNPNVLEIQYANGDRIRYVAKSEGQSTLTINGSNGTVTTILVTVKEPKYQLQNANEIEIYSGTSKTFGFSYADEMADWYWHDDYFTKVFPYPVKKDFSIDDSRLAEFGYSGEYGKINIVGKDPGVTYLNLNGDRFKITVIPTQTYLNNRSTITKSVKYGDKQLTVSTVPGATVSTIIGGKTYTANVGGSGTQALSIPELKCGSAIDVLFNYQGVSCKKRTNVVSNSDAILKSYVYRNSKKVKITVKNAHYGDVLTMKIGKKTYKKVIKTNASQYTVTFKIKKPNKYGKRIRTILKDKYGGVLYDNNNNTDLKQKYVFYGKKIKKKMTKKQVKWLSDWGTPHHINHYTKTEQWVYGLGLYVYFRGGKVVGWQY